MVAPLSGPGAQVTYIAVGATSARSDSRAAIYLTLLPLAAAYFLAWPIWRVQFLIEIWPTESWNAYLQDAAGAGAPLNPSCCDVAGDASSTLHGN
jgi:hypothetical protein